MKREEIVEGLRSLGVRKGDILLVHSSLASLGHVEGGADAVIDALMEAVGEEGTLAMPTFASPDRVFDRRKSPTGLGLIPEVFWRREGVVRSMHPTHSVAAWGRRSLELIADHEKAPDAYGEGTPYKKIADWGGYILLLGVDLDRCTMLHTAEALVDAPYLRTVEASYVDDDGEVHQIKVKRMAGPHRNFIGLTRIFVERGIMLRRRIGKALCSLIKASEMLDLCIMMLREEPGAMLCDNPACLDCRRQRGAIKRKDLAGLPISSFGVNSMEISDDLEEVLRLVEGEGFPYLELSMVNGRFITEFREHEVRKLKGDLDSAGLQVCGIDLGRRLIEGVVDESFEIERAVHAAQILGARNVVIGVMPTAEVKFLEGSGFFSSLAERGEKESIVFMVENMASPEGDFKVIIDALMRVNSPHLRLAYNPAHYGQMGGRPFLDIFPFGKLAAVRGLIGQVYLSDGIKGSFGTYVPLGNGNAEIKELLSILACRGFDGFLIIKSKKIPSISNFEEESARLWRMVREVL